MLIGSTNLLEKLMYIKIFHHFWHIENWRYSTFFRDFSIWLSEFVLIEYHRILDDCTSKILSNMSMRITHLFKFQKLAQSDGFEKISDSPKLPNGNLRGSRKLSNHDAMSKIAYFCFEMVAFHKGLGNQKVSKKCFFRALTCLGIFSAAGGALKTKKLDFWLKSNQFSRYIKISEFSIISKIVKNC